MLLLPALPLDDSAVDVVLGLVLGFLCGVGVTARVCGSCGTPAPEVDDEDDVVSGGCGAAA